MVADDSDDGLPRRLRKRKVQHHSYDDGAALQQLLEVAAGAQKIVVFSGSGLSASSGMSTFSTRGGLYERAQKKYKLADGKMLFTYAFFDRQRPEAQAFFADIYSEAVSAEPAAGHHALRQLYDAGRLHRHYTLNIDGLAQQVGMDTWHHEHNTAGVTVEMHGNVHYLVCPQCHATAPMSAALARQIRAREPLPCTAPGCGRGLMRFKVMMYDDGEAECITPDDVMDLMEEDVKAADLVLWVGISFQQSASTMYFRKARCWIQEAGRLGQCVQALVNPSDEALFNLRTAMSNQSELRVLEVLAESDEVLPLLADRLRTPGGGGAAAAAVDRARAAAAAAAHHRAKLEEARHAQQAHLDAAALTGTAAAPPPNMLAAAVAVLAGQQPLVKQESLVHGALEGSLPQAVLPLPPLPVLPTPLQAALPQLPMPAALLHAVGFPGSAAAAAAQAGLLQNMQQQAVQQLAAQQQPGAEQAPQEQEQQHAHQQAHQQQHIVQQPPQQKEHQETIHMLSTLQATLQAALQQQLAQQQQEQQQQQQAATPLLAQLLGGLQSAASALQAQPQHQLQQQPLQALVHAQLPSEQGQGDGQGQAESMQAAAVAATGQQCGNDSEAAMHRVLVDSAAKREQSPQAVVLQEHDSRDSEEQQEPPPPLTTGAAVATVAAAEAEPAVPASS